MQAANPQAKGTPIKVAKYWFSAITLAEPLPNSPKNSAKLKKEPVPAKMIGKCFITLFLSLNDMSACRAQRNTLTAANCKIYISDRTPSYKNSICFMRLFLDKRQKAKKESDCILAVTYRNYLFLFSHCWLAIPQEVLQADWQEVWHSPQPPFFALSQRFFVSRVLIRFIFISSKNVLLKLSIS